MIKFRKSLIVNIIALLATQLPAQQFLLQGWYWDYPKAGAGHSWADTLALRSKDLAQAGFTHVWFPPHAACTSGSLSNGYDPRDLFIGNATTGVGSRADLDAMLDSMVAHGIDPVGDLVYNHRDGGYPEANPSVEGWIENMTAAKINLGDQPFPSDRVFCILPLSSSGANGAGDYYFKVKSASLHGNFYGKPYKIYMQTNKTGWQNLPNLNEAEPNGGGGCGEPNNDVFLGRDMFASVDGSGCFTDEFHLNLNGSQFFATDTLFIYFNNRNVNGLGDYSDHYITEVWHNGQNIQPQLKYMTWTNFANMPSGRGTMNHSNFKPNGNPTQLAGDVDGMYFFYDYDQANVPSTIDTLHAWTKWNWTDLGVRGLRMDAVKHFGTAFVGNMLDFMHGQGMNPSLVVGESFTTDIGQLSGWVNGVLANMDAATQAAIKPKVFDFNLREKLRQVCDHNVDARDLFHAGCVENGMSGFNTVTFVNNHDFRDAAPGFNAMVKNDVELAYAYILTNNKLGVPTVFYPDYFGYPATGSGFDQPYHPSDKAPHTTEINQLMRAHKNHIVGATQSIYLNDYGTTWAATYNSGTASQCAIFQLQHPAGSGKKPVLVAINFGNSALDVSQSISNPGNLLPVGEVFSPQAGVPVPLTLGVNGRVRIQLPARSFGVWVPGVPGSCN